MKQTKDQLRQKMKNLRQEVLGDKIAAGDHAAAHFLKGIDLDPGTVVSAYWAMNTELPTLSLMVSLHDRGYNCCLPVTREGQARLSFVRWVPDSHMVPGYHKILIPDSEDFLEPDVLVIPLLAFTRDGHRLGFGKGHYDHTLEHLRSRKRIIAIGYGYAQQEVDSLPQDQYDQVLDYIVTNREVIRITF